MVMFAKKHGWSFPLVQNIIWLVASTPLKNMKVRWDDYSIYEMENKKL
jgi:hypothetical protein